MEIEKKFQVKILPENLEEFPKKEIEQGYLCVNPVVRIRKSNERFILTYKSRNGVEKTIPDAQTSQEIEAPLT